jgi:hypothetical protein
MKSKEEERRQNPIVLESKTTRKKRTREKGERARERNTNLSFSLYISFFQ